jgi:hypothetical protein
MKPRKRELAISEEAANNTVEIFLDYYEIFPDEITNTDEKNNLVGAIDATIGFIRAGHVMIESTEDGDVNIIQNLKLSKGEAKKAIYESANLTKAKTEMKSCKNDDLYGKMYALMGSLSGNGSTWIKNFKGIDQRVMEALSVLFLQCTSG